MRNNVQNPESKGSGVNEDGEGIKDRAGEAFRSVRCVPCKQEDPSLVLGTCVLCFWFSMFLPLIVHYKLTTTEVETGDQLDTHLVKSQWEATSQKEKVDSI